MKIYFKKKNPVSNYVWRKTFCFLPRFVKDHYGETSPLVWLTWVYRRGPFKISDQVVNTDNVNVVRFRDRMIGERYEYRLDCPPMTHALHVPAHSGVTEMLIDSPEEYRRKSSADFFQKEKLEKWMKMALGNKELFNKEYYKDYDKATEPIAEGTGMKK